MDRDRNTRRDRWRLGVVGVLGAALLRALGATWRVRVEGPDPFASGRPFVGALWHRGLLLAAWLWRDRNVAVPVSRSRDGDLIAAVLGQLGFDERLRGSSSRGGSMALRGSIRLLRAGRPVGVLSDGPRGPARVLKPGAVAMARLSGAPVVPVALSARPVLRFGSWDRAFLPLPFARVVCRYGLPRPVPNRPGEAALETERAELERLLEASTRELDAALGLPGEDRPGSESLPESTGREPS